MKKLKFLLIAAALLCSAMLLGACGETAGEKEYKVTVTDAFGNVYSGVIVRFMQDGEQVAMQVCDENGVAAKTLESGDYTVELKFTDDAEGYYYDAEGLKLTAKETELDVQLSYAINEETSSQELMADSKAYKAYTVQTGCTYTELIEGERNYFLFAPTEAGTYEFSVADGADVEIGYYGAPHFVQSMSAAEVVDNKFTISVKASMIGTGDTGTTVIVIGVDSKADTKACVLGIQRTGDPEHTIEDEPWTVYQTTGVLSLFTLEEGTELVDFDLTADSYNLVYNEFDGYYHLNSEDGPLVYVYLTENTTYLDSFETIVSKSGVVKYFYDENGEFEKKESYTECLMKYIENADKDSGVYPLTEDLKYILQQRGDHSGWYDKENSGYLFKDVNGNPISGINSEIAWLFACCYEN